jgi:flagellar motility protein MotE (MotC chaperone)
MIRSLLAIAGIFCAMVVLAEGIGLAVLWFTGSLNGNAIREIRAVLQEGLEPKPMAQAKEPEVQAPSHDEIREARLMRILQLNARESELKILKRMTSDTANQLISDRQAFDQLKLQFRSELQRLDEQNQTTATEQTRTVLMATAPEEAVQRLMALAPAEAVELVRGLPEKTIARILQAFQLDPKTAPRGQELFEALYRGQPHRSLIENTLKHVDPADEGTRRGG